MVVNLRTTDEIETAVGAQFRARRLDLDLDQKRLARAAGVSIGAVQNLENGRGSTLRTLIRLARVLEREDWLDEFYEEPTLSPLALLREREGRSAQRRASRRAQSAAEPSTPKMRS